MSLTSWLLARTVLFTYADLLDIEHIGKQIGNFIRKVCTPPCNLITSFLSLLDPTVGAFYRGSLYPLKYFVTFVLLWVFGALFWKYGFKNLKKVLKNPPKFFESTFAVILFYATIIIRVGTAFALVQFGMEFTIAHYGERIVSNICYEDFTSEMVLLDASTWPNWCRVLGLLLLIRVALSLLVDIVRLRPLPFLGMIIHIFCFLSLGWLLGNLVYVLDQIYHNMTLATALFGIVAGALSWFIRSVIPFFGAILIAMLGLCYLYVVGYPFFALFFWILSLFGGSGAPSETDSSETKTKKMIVESRYDNGHEVFREEREATFLDVILADNPLAAAIWFFN